MSRKYRAAATGGILRSAQPSLRRRDRAMTTLMPWQPICRPSPWRRFADTPRWAVVMFGRVSTRTWCERWLAGGRAVCPPPRPDLSWWPLGPDEGHLRKECGRVPHRESDHPGGHDRHPQTEETHQGKPAQCEHQPPQRGPAEHPQLVTHGEHPGGGGPRPTGPFQQHRGRHHR